MTQKSLTLSMPSFGRPQRTIRAIECIAKQNINNWEALVTGDGCDVMKGFIESGYFLDIINDCQKNGNDLIIRNHLENKGNCGYAITNEHIKMAKGKWFLFYANDDVILENHFHNYLSEVENTNLDFTWFDSWVNCSQTPRISSLNFGCIGHSELMIKTSFLKKMPSHDPIYGHDFTLIKNMIKNSKNYRKAISKMQTYWVMSVPNNQEKNID